MPPLVFKKQEDPDLQRVKDERRARMDEIKALFAAGDFEAGNAAMAAYQEERAAEIRRNNQENG